MPLTTLTHARLRARQGDREGALRIVEQILERNPDDEEALALLGELKRSVGRPARVAEAEPSLAEPESVEPSELAASFRRELGRDRLRGPRDKIRRLEAWLERIARGAP